MKKYSVTVVIFLVLAVLLLVQKRNTTTNPKSSTIENPSGQTNIVVTGNVTPVYK